ANLVNRLEESQLDNYTDIRTLIGIVFDENTVWGKLTIIELKILIYLALGAHEDAIELVGEFLQFNDNTVKRGLFYQAMNAVLEVTLDEELELDDFIHNFNRMFGKDVMDNVVGSVTGKVRFYGLTKTSMQLEGIEPHLRLIESYKKLHQARKAAKNLN
ncbi:MAG: OsmC domain/YcaO domain-containing protein, partial [Shewanella oncorhynchi]